MGPTRRAGRFEPGTGPADARNEDPYEVVTRTRSASLLLATESAGGFASPGGPLRAHHVRSARGELDQRGRASFLAERWATQPIAARARVIWVGWAQMFAGSLRWQQHADDKEITPRMRERLDELTALLSGPATRGELRVLESYEAYFQTLFTLGWALVQRIDPAGDNRRLPVAAGEAGDLAAAENAWTELRRAWTAPWIGRRRHQQIADALMHWIDPPSPAMLTQQESDS
jgi:hypothetical protein